MALLTGLDTLDGNNQFSEWLYRTNELSVLMRDDVMTANSSGANTVGDAILLGTFVANTIVVVDEIRGGDYTSNSDLTISTNTVFSGDLVTVDNDLEIGNHRIVSNTVNVTSNTATNIDEFPLTESKGFKYLVHAENTNDSNSAYMVEILCTHNGTDLLYTRYGELGYDIDITLTPGINGANVELEAVCPDASGTDIHTFTIVRTEVV